MCKCRPNVRTPFCGRHGCEWPAQANYAPPSHETIREQIIGKIHMAVRTTFFTENKKNMQFLADDIEAIIAEACTAARIEELERVGRLSYKASDEELIHFNEDGSTVSMLSDRIADLNRQKEESL